MANPAAEIDEWIRRQSGDPSDAPMKKELQAVEAEISPDGQLTLLEPLHLAQQTRAVVTILTPIDEPVPTRASSKALLDMLDSADFATAQPGDPVRMAREIAVNRAWGD